jgi:hypothetical protein
MQAHSGDWLVVHSQTEGGHLRKGEIITTHADGGPPYSVRWLDDNRESVVFPGPDAQIVSADDQVKLDRAQSKLINRVQSDINQHAAD